MGKVEEAKEVKKVKEVERVEREPLFNRFNFFNISTFFLSLFRCDGVSVFRRSGHI